MNKAWETSKELKKIQEEINSYLFNPDPPKAYIKLLKIERTRLKKIIAHEQLKSRTDYFGYSKSKKG